MTDRFIRIEDVMQRTTMARSTVYKRMSDGEFPRNRKIGRTAVWSEKEVSEFIEWIKRK